MFAEEEMNSHLPIKKEKTELTPKSQMMILQKVIGVKLTNV